MENPYEGQPDRDAATWLPKTETRALNPHMTRAFALEYERIATRITGRIAYEALQRVDPLHDGLRVLDIAAGAGALSIPVAHSGAAVTGIDIAPGMVELLAERLRPFPRAEAREMDGEALEFADGSFDLAFSIVGVNLFADPRRGLAEMARVVRPGGSAVVATWREPPGGGPLLIVAKAMSTLFPDRRPPAPPAGFVALAEPDQVGSEFASAGFHNISVDLIDAVWEGPAGQDYLDEMRGMHPYMGPYALLSDEEREAVDRQILSVVDEIAEDGRIRLSSPVTIASAVRS